MRDTITCHGLCKKPVRMWSGPGSNIYTQAAPGSGCPLTMTFSSILTIRHQPDIAQAWIPIITAALYDPRNLPYYEKLGLTIGMAMTEKQGGSDVRANATRAFPIDAPGPGESAVWP